MAWYRQNTTKQITSHNYNPEFVFYPLLTVCIVYFFLLNDSSGLNYVTFLQRNHNKS